MTDAELQAICERVSKAAPGPWIRHGSTVESADYTEPHPSGRECMFLYDEGGHTVEDAEFIAHARTDVPILLAEVEALQGILGDCQTDSGAYQAGYAAGLEAGRQAERERVASLLNQVKELQGDIEAEHYLRMEGEY